MSKPRREAMVMGTMLTLVLIAFLFSLHRNAVQERERQKPIYGTMSLMVRNQTTMPIIVHFRDSLYADRYTALPQRTLCWNEVGIPNIVSATPMANWVLADTGGAELVLTDSSAHLRLHIPRPC